MASIPFVIDPAISCWPGKACSLEPNLKLPVQSAGAVPAELAEALKSAIDYAAASKSAATRKAYRADWLDFHTWCESVNAAALPAAAETLASYLAHLIQPVWNLS
jgi:hypothetical protein